MAGKINLEKVIEYLLEKGDLPGAAEVIRFVLEVKPDDEYSAQELASLILKDYGLTNRVIRMANSCFYNPSGVEITTVSRAIVFLGFNFIKEIALATSFLEEVLARTPKSSREEVLRLLAQSYFVAFMARRMSPHLKVDCEQIFILALFHRLPRILLAMHLPQVYQKLREIEAENPVQAQKILFQLGDQIAKKWALPRTLAEAFEGSPQTKHKNQAVSFVTNLAQACELVIEKGEKAALNLLFEEVGLKPKLVEKFVEDSLEAVKDLNSSLVPFLKKCQPKRKKEEKKKPLEEDFFQKAVAEITALLASPNFNCQQILLMVIESVCRALGCRNVFLGILNPRKKSLTLRYGVGDGVRNFLNKQIPVSKLIEEIFQKQVEWSGRVSAIPEANLWAEIAPGADLLFSPLIVLGKPLGMIFALRERPFTLEEHQKVNTLRNLAVLSIVQEKQRQKALRET